MQRGAVAVTTIHLKRIYDAPSPEDGYRVLVDRVWPRGMTKEKADIDLWAKDIAPSAELRKWFCHDPAKWSDFQKKYREELERNKPALKDLMAKAGEKGGRLTLLYGAKDEEHNQAVVLHAFMQSM
nr:DUF488 domain-containing protein [Brucella intermedia]